MIANLYISSKSFEFNGSDSNSEISEKIANFYNLVTFVNSLKQDQFFVNWTDLTTTIIASDNLTIDMLVFGQIQDLPIEFQNVAYLLRKIIHSLRHDGSTEDVLIETINKLSENDCNGLVVFNKLYDYKIGLEKQIITNKDDWYSFHRYYLSYFPIAPEYFLDECKIYFPHLLISECVKREIRDVFNTHIKKICNYLTFLNDNLLNEWKISPIEDFHIFLDAFYRKYGIDEATNQGDKNSKLYKDFKLEDGSNKTIYCNPHLKMFSDDKENSNSHCRIYFKTPDKSDKLIYVGLITKHV